MRGLARACSLVQTLLLALDEPAGQRILLRLQVFLRDGDDERRVGVMRVSVDLNRARQLPGGSQASNVEGGRE